VVVRTGNRVFVTPAKAPNAIRVAATIGGLTWNGAGPASLGVTPAAIGQRSFSPNGDHSKDAIRIDWTNARPLDRLVLRVYRANGTLVGEVPVRQLGAGRRTTTWNGIVAGRRVPNGRYLVTLVGRIGRTTLYNPSAAFQAASLALHGVTVDTVAPTVRSASITSGLLSPNGDGIRESVIVSLVTTGATAWAFGVAPVVGSGVGAPVLIRSGGGGTANVTWTGRTSSGVVVPDGMYRLQAVAADPAGNRVSRTWTVRVDRTPPAIVPAAPPAFSPNGDGVADTARLTWTSAEPVTGTAAVYHGSKLIRSWKIATAAVSGAVTWPGTDAAGRRVADGTYSFRVSGRDLAGNAAARATPVRVDRTLGSVGWASAAFYPNDGDALAATARMSFRLARTATVSAGVYWRTTLVRTIWTGRSLGAGAHTWTWNGRNDAGAFTGPGTYTLRVTARSGIGTTVLTRDILVDAYAVSLSSASVRAGQTLSITVIPTEAPAGAPAVTFKQPGRPAVRRTATASGGGRYRVSFVVARGSAGTGTVTITGRDSRGGTDTTSRSVAVR
jgi:flagellar hook assembly protein FlgD